MSNTSKNLFGKKAYWMNSMPIPYRMLAAAAAAIVAGDMPTVR